MAYGVKYTVDFNTYQLRISEKDYVGSSSAILAGNPAVRHRWDLDDPTPPIKGSSLTANIIDVPLLSFYANNDDQFKGELYNGSDLLFSGFLVQDDCTEDVDDLSHVVTLSFTDNLGLLKDVSFGDVVGLPSVSSGLYNILSSGFNIDINGLPTLEVGDTFTIISSGSNLGTYTIATVVDANSYTTTTSMPALSGFQTIASSKIVASSKITLFAVVTACLKATGLEIPLEIFSALAESSTTGDSSFFEKTLIARETFLKSEREYMNCYDVLEWVMSTFEATLKQANGQWNIIRWHEHEPTSYQYDSAFARVGTGAYNDFKVSGYEEAIYPEYGYRNRVVRPFNVVKETFNYKVPPQLLKNADMKDLGALLSTVTVNEEDYKPDEDADGTNDYTVTYNEYAFTDWSDSTLAPQTSDARIRVVTDSLGNERERYVLVRYDAIKSTPIEANVGDVVNITLSMRSGVGPVSVPSTTQFFIEIKDGTRTRYADEDGSWKLTPGYSVSGQNTYKDWTTVNITTGRIPFDGLLTVYLHILNASETHYNDIRFEYQAYINESTKITGHTHTHTQAINIKNKEEIDINIDDAPRNFISGALFTSALNGNIQARTKLWSYGLGSPKKLGEITTQEVKQWRSRARTILEGNLYGDPLCSPMTTFTNPAFPDLNFVPGMMEIDYGNNFFSGTLHELYETGEAAATSVYKFDYIYNTK